LPGTPEPVQTATHASPVRSLIQKLLVLFGNSMTLIGCVGLLLGATGIVSLEAFATGISSGVRVVGSVAVAGCLLSAIGYGIVDYLDK
jgi:hydroxyethylthiazole kinase-like sugar kinase family protein